MKFTLNFEFLVHLMNGSALGVENRLHRDLTALEPESKWVHSFHSTRQPIDQVKFMKALVQPDRLRDRILRWVEDEGQAGALPKKAGRILEAVLYRGELRRGGDS